MGFVQTCGGAAMGLPGVDDLPFYYSMAPTSPSATATSHSVMAQTYPNRRFLIAGTVLGNISTDDTGISKIDAPNGTIFDRLNDARDHLEGLLPGPTDRSALLAGVLEQPVQGRPHEPNSSPTRRRDSLPAVRLVDPYTNFSEEDGDITVGQAYAARFVDAVMCSPHWSRRH